MAAFLAHRRAFMSGAMLFVAAAVFWSGACAQADTVVSVRVRGSIDDVQQLQVTLTIAGQMRTLMIPDPPRAISLPTSFTVQMDRALQGRLQVTVDAFDGSGRTIARGNWALNNLAIGQTNQVQIDLTPNGGGMPDGGMPDGGDAGSSTDAPAGTGGAGMGGGAGTGGAGAGGMTGTGGAGAGGAGTGGGASGGAGTGGAATGGAGTGGSGTGGDSGAAGGTSAGGGGGSDD